MNINYVKNCRAHIFLIGNLFIGPIFIDMVQIMLYRPDTRNEVVLLSAESNNLHDIRKYGSHENNINDQDVCPAILNTFYIHMPVNRTTLF